MDVPELAGAVVGLIVPYLQRAADKLTDHAVDGAMKKVAQLYRTLRDRLRPGSYEANQLAGVEERPDSEGRSAALRGALAEYLAAEPELAGELARLVEEARVAGATVHAADSGITAGGDVDIRAGGDVVGRDKTS
jgi:hypothetical protein